MEERRKLQSNSHIVDPGTLISQKDWKSEWVVSGHGPPGYTAGQRNVVRQVESLECCEDGFPKKLPPGLGESCVECFQGRALDS